MIIKAKDLYLSSFLGEIKEELNMMNYNEFKEKVINEFLEYFPKEKESYKVIVSKVNKTNVKYDSILLCKCNHNPKEGVAAPALYINHMYDEYRQCGDFEATLSWAADVYRDRMERVQEDVKYFDEQLDDIEELKNNVVFSLINTEQNMEIIENVPHRDFLDLSLTYKLVLKIKDDDNEIASVLINNKNVESLLGNVTEEELFKLAFDNTKRIFKPTVTCMDEVIKQMLIQQGMSEEFAENIMGYHGEEEMYMISNKQRFNGAISIIYENVFHELAEQMESNLWILPSSIHELIVLRAMGEPEDLAQIVATINMKEVDLENRLSNSVYFYDRSLRKTSFAINERRGLNEIQ